MNEDHEETALVVSKAKVEIVRASGADVLLAKIRPAHARDFSMPRFVT